MTAALSATRDVAASCQRVWDVLAEGWSYTHTLSPAR
jgi:hypothetical protein